MSMDTKNRNILSVSLVLTLLISSAFIVMNVDDSSGATVVRDDLVFTTNDSLHTASVAPVNKNIVIADIPATFIHNDSVYLVTSIGANAFLDCVSLSVLIIPEGIVSTGSNAFKGCISLISVTLPSSLKTIGTSSFAGCTSLTSAVISDGIEVLGNSMFNGCSSLLEVTLPLTLVSIGTYVFYGCSSLLSIEIPYGTESIGNYALGGCSSLLSIDIPSTVHTIGQCAFHSCIGLNELVIPSLVTELNLNIVNVCTLTLYVLDHIVLTGTRPVNVMVSVCIVLIFMSCPSEGDVLIP